MTIETQDSSGPFQVKQVGWAGGIMMSRFLMAAMLALTHIACALRVVCTWAVCLLCAMNCSCARSGSPVSDTRPVHNPYAVPDSVLETAPRYWPANAEHDELVDVPAGIPAAVVVYAEPSRMIPVHIPPLLIVAAWNDGRTLRSADNVQGGQPYSSGSIAPDEVKSLVARLTRCAIENQLRPRAARVGPDYPRTHVYFRSEAGTVYEISSDHELMRAMEIGAADDKFKTMWSTFRRLIDEAVPKGSSVADSLGFRFVRQRR